MSKKDIVLSVEDLTVSFDGFKAVDDLSFYVDEGEIRVIIGPNGAGKTTVLDLILLINASSLMWVSMSKLYPLLYKNLF